MQWNIDVDGTPSFGCSGADGFVTVSMKLRFGGIVCNVPTLGVGQKRIWLRERLAVELPNPFRRTICRDEYKGNVAIIGFADARKKIEEGTSARDAHYNGFACGEPKTDGDEGGTTLVGDGMKAERMLIVSHEGTLVKVVNDDCVSASRAHDCVLNAGGKEVRCEYVDVCFIAEH